MALAAQKEALLSVRFLWVFARVSRGVEQTQQIFAREKLGPAEYFDPETRVRHSAIMELLKVNVDAGDVDIGLRAGDGLQPGDYATLEYAARSCPTLGDAVRCFARYVGLLHEATEITLIEQGEHVVWRHRVTDGVVQLPAANDFVMASAHAFARTYCHVYEPPLEVHFAHPEPASRAAYEKVFRTTLRFGAPDNAFVLARKQLDIPLTRSDPALRSDYERHAEDLLAKIRGNAGITLAVRRVLLADLRTGGFTMATTARKLAMSVATLRRRLLDEDTTYAAVLDLVRHDLAKKYLRDRSIATNDIAFLLGFRDGSSFAKAFRRWTGGVSPSEFRLSPRDH